MLLWLPIVLMYSCTFNEQGSGIAELIPKPAGREPVKEINIPEHLDTMSFDYNKNLTDVRYVKLESRKDCLIGKVDKVIATRNGFVIADYFVSNAVFFFDSVGQLKKKLSLSESNSFPRMVRDIAYNYDNNTVYLYDDKTMAIGCYKESGEFIRRYKADQFYFRRFSYMGDSLFLIYRPFYTQTNSLNAYELIVSDLEWNIKYKMFPDKKEFQDDFDYNYNVASENGKNYYSRKFSDYIYEISSDTASVFPAFKFNFASKNTMNRQVLPSSNSREVVKLLSANNYFFDGLVLSTNAYDYVGVSKKSGMLGVFYSRKTGKIMGGNTIANRAVTDTSYVEYFTYPVATVNNQFISLMMPDLFVKSEQVFTKSRKELRMKPPIREKNLQQIMNTTKADDNPVLIIYTIKPF